MVCVQGAQSTVTVNRGGVQKAGYTTHCGRVDLTLVHPPVLQPAAPGPKCTSPGLEIHDGMFSFFHALNGFLQPTRQIHALPLADLKAELPAVKDLVLVVPFQRNWRERQATYQGRKQAGDRGRMPTQPPPLPRHFLLPKRPSAFSDVEKCQEDVVQPPTSQRSHPGRAHQNLTEPPHRPTSPSTRAPSLGLAWPSPRARILLMIPPSSSSVRSSPLNSNNSTCGTRCEGSQLRSRSEGSLVNARAGLTARAATAGVAQVAVLPGSWELPWLSCGRRGQAAGFTSAQEITLCTRHSRTVCSPDSPNAAT